MRALILAAGFGRRMAPVTEVIPKPLLPIGGISAIRHNVSKLVHYGIREIVVNLHHFPDLIKNELSEIKDVTFFFSEEKQILGTAGGIKKAIDFLGSEDFLIVNSDILSDINYSALINFHLEKKAACTMALRQDAMADFYGPVEIDGSGKIGRFLGKGISGKYGKYMFTGIQVMNSSFLENVKKGKFCDLSKEVYPEKVAAGDQLFGFVTESYWSDIGKPSSLLKANRYFIHLFSKISSLLTEHRFNNSSIIHKSSALYAQADETIFGSFIGKNVMIEKGVVVENSIVMNDATIKRNAVIKDSIIGPKTILEADTTFEKMVVSSVSEKIKINRF